MLKISRSDSFGFHEIGVVDSTYDSELGATLEHLVGTKTFSTKRGADKWTNEQIRDYAIEHGHVKIMI